MSCLPCVENRSCGSVTIASLEDLSYQVDMTRAEFFFPNALLDKGDESGDHDHDHAGEDRHECGDVIPVSADEIIIVD